MNTKRLALMGLGILTAAFARGRRRHGSAHVLDPLHQLDLYLDGFHFESGRLENQTRACHYCSRLREDLTQCVIFDRPGSGARLIGVEYIIPEKVFRALPEEEKPLWHSHQFEVKSGLLAAPGLPAWAELELLDEFRTSYGKTWHTWDTSYQSALPLGIPKLMMSFTEEGQLNPGLAAERDRLAGISTERNRQRRAHLGDSAIQNGADAWEKGEVVQIHLTPTAMNYRG